MKRKWMITGVGVGAAAALVLALAGRGGFSLPSKHRTVSFAPPATGGSAAARRSRDAAHRRRPDGEAGATALAATSSAPSTAPVTERGVALAQRMRDDICRCETRECWHRASATFKGTIGLAVPTNEEETEVIEAAMREMGACIKRIGAAEAQAAAAREAAAGEAPEGG
ncbi:hypothetical protein [Sorangium sp. So ce131]|uniref:hypothetical protein n=1 Tax=Sorangium sp. So ce131 TaxID=3133282 RepID=UPI003F5EE969